MLLVCAALVLPGSGAHAAGMLGDTIQSCFWNTGLCGSALSTGTNLWVAWGAPGGNMGIVSNSGIEFGPTTTSSVSADFLSDGDALQVFMPSGGWAEVEFFFHNLNPARVITSFAFDDGGLPVSETSFTANSFYFKVAGGSHGNVFGNFSLSSTVPEPAPLVLLGLGLAAVNLRRARRVA